MLSVPLPPLFFVPAVVALDLFVGVAALSLGADCLPGKVIFLFPVESLRAGVAAGLFLFVCAVGLP